MVFVDYLDELASPSLPTAAVSIASAAAAAAPGTLHQRAKSTDRNATIVGSIVIAVATRIRCAHRRRDVDVGCRASTDGRCRRRQCSFEPSSDGASGMAHATLHSSDNDSDISDSSTDTSGTVSITMRCRQHGFGTASIAPTITSRVHAYGIACACVQSFLRTKQKL